MTDLGGHVPVPSEHAPRKETLQEDILDIMIREPDREGAWIATEEPVEVHR